MLDIDKLVLTERVIQRALTWSIILNGFYCSKLKSSLRKFYCFNKITWLTVVEYLCHKWSRIWPCLSYFRHSKRTTVSVARRIRRVSLVVQELLTLPEHLRWTHVFLCCSIV